MKEYISILAEVKCACGRTEARRNHAQDSSFPLLVQFNVQSLISATIMSDNIYAILIISEAHPSLDIQSFYCGWSPSTLEVSNG